MGISEDGKRRLKQYREIYGKNPVIKDITDAAFYGLITEEECIERYKKTDRIQRKLCYIFGIIRILSFSVWIILSSIAWTMAYFTADGMGNQITLSLFLEGPIVGTLGIVISTYCLSKSRANESINS